MPYYTGSISTYDELLTAVANACTANGWTYSSGILSKGNAFFKLSAVSTGTYRGLNVEGGTGQSGATLLGPAGSRSRCGPPTTGATWGQPGWPAVYHIHIGLLPDEVYVVINLNVTDYYWLAFGTSNVPGLTGTGAWTSGCGSGDTGGSNTYISSNGGISDTSNSCCAPFWASTRSSGIYAYESVQTDSNNVWSGQTSQPRLVGISLQSPLIGRLPSVWNSETVLLPITVYQEQPESKARLIADLGHARYARINFIDPGQVLSFGPDRWKVYPFFRKNASIPDPGSYATHTGTFGWAIRYDGA